MFPELRVARGSQLKRQSLGGESGGGVDDVLERFRGIPWHFAHHDGAARREIHNRIATAGKRADLITYSDLVRGIAFTLPQLHEPTHRIDPGDWQDLDRAIVGDFLGYVSMESYEKAGFLASALVVSKLDGTPGKGFFELLKILGLIADVRSGKATNVWLDNVEKAHEWYGAGRFTA